MPIKLNKKCLEEVITFEHQGKGQKHGVIKSERLIGKIVPSKDFKKTNKNKQIYIYKALGNNKFSKRKTKVPTHYKRKTYTKKSLKRYKSYLEDFYCTEKKVPKNIQGFEVNKWMNRIRKHYLRISDVLKMKKGDKIKLLVLDRNVTDITSKNKTNKELVSYTPKHFFRKNFAVYTHNSKLKGTIKYFNINSMNFQFEIEYQKNNWYPLNNNGKLGKKDRQGFADFKDKAGLHYSEFPKSTPLGFRGPMIKYSSLKDLPKVYWYTK